MKLLIINGPNLNLLGLREPEIYGKESYADLLERIKVYCNKKKIEVDFFQSNHEGSLVDRIQNAFGKYDGLILNPGAYTHTSIAIPDAVRAVGLPTVEVHISDPDRREDYRKINYIRAACVFTVKGRGTQGYLDAVDYFDGGKSE